MFKKEELKILSTLLKIGRNTLIFSFLVGSFADAAPQSGKVTLGQANISTKGSVTNITQSTKKASINWNKFSINKNETVNFKQPNKSSITLNRVTGSERSVINGALNANGQVWILNSNGVLFGKNAKINTAGLLATTKNLTDKDFLAGKYNFKGNSKNSVINLGEIEITNAGYAALLGHKVSNEGSIKAIKGTIKLVGGSQYSINLNGNSLVSLKVEKSFIDSLVENKGALIANGGEIYLTTSSAEELLKGTVNNTGVIEANSFEDITGYVELFAHGGEVQVGGSIKAKDGFIETSGKDFSIAKDSSIEAKKWLIDPVDITIGNTLATTVENSLKTGDVTIQTTDSKSSINGSAQSTDTSGDGNIYVNSPITWSVDNTLTLDAYNNIVVNEDITHTGTSNGGVIFLYGQRSANGGTSTYTLASGKSVNANSIQWRKGNNLNSYRYAIVDNNLYIGTEFIELGLNSSLGGKFGTTTKPSLFFGRKTGSGIGMTGDADGFGVGDDLRIDYFLPGSPAEQFTVAYGDDYDVSGKNFARDLSKYKLLGLNDNNELEMSVVSNLSSLEVKQVFKLGLTDKYYNTNVTLTNTSDTNLSNVIFIRSFDPDNTVDHGGRYDTINTIEKLISTGDTSTVVSAQSQSGDSYYSTTGNQAKVLFFTTDNQALVGYGSEFFSGDTSDIKTMISTAEGLSKGSTNTADEGIGIIFKYDTLLPSAEQNLSYYTSLDNRPIETIIDELNNVESIPLIYTLTNKTKTYNSNNYLLSDYYTNESIFGSEYSDWVLGTDYNFMYDGNLLTSITDAGMYEVYIDILKEGYTEANYGNTNGFFTINTKAITADFSASNKVYDGNINAQISLNSLDGIFGSDSVGISNTAYGMFSDKNAGNDKVVSISGITLSGEDANNYHLVSSTDTATANITKRDINASFVATNKTYDGSSSANVTLNSWDNLVESDDLNASSITASFNDKNAGNDKVVTIDNISLTGEDADNYHLVSSTDTATADINKRDINASFVTSDKTYDGSSSANVSFNSWDNLVENDDLNASSITASFNNKNAGNDKVVTIDNISLTGGDADNYNLVSSDSTKADINKRDINASFVATNKTYDGSSSANVSFNSWDNLVENDDLNASSITASFNDKNAGNDKVVTIDNISLTGEDADNYNLVSSDSTKADINKRDINASFIASDKTYDGTTNANVSFSSWDNLVESDDLNTASITASFNDKNAGNDKVVTIDNISLTGEDANNYNLVSSDSTKADINKRNINASFVASNKIYNGETLTELKFSSWDNYLNSDDLSVDNYVGNFVDPYSGNNKDIIVTDTILTGKDKDNYNLVGSTSTNADITENKVEYILASIDNTTSIKTPISNDIKTPIDSLQRKGNNIQREDIVSTPKVASKTKKVTHSEVQSMQGTTETKVPIGENSILTINGSGVNLTSKDTQVEQIFYVTEYINDK